MEQNLDQAAAEIQKYLDAEHFIVFHSSGRQAGEGQGVHWDTEAEPDFRRYLECAQQVGVRLVHFCVKRYGAEQKEMALEMLEDADLPREEKRGLEKRIQAMTRFEGFVSALELSFDFEGRTYYYSLETEWHEEWESILDDLEDATAPPEEGEHGYGGFYSNN